MHSNKHQKESFVKIWRYKQLVAGTCFVDHDDLVEFAIVILIVTIELSSCLLHEFPHFINL